MLFKVYYNSWNMYKWIHFVKNFFVRANTILLLKRAWETIATERKDGVYWSWTSD